MSEPQLMQYIECNVELTCPGPSENVARGWTAAALRKIASKLERGEYQDGHHEVTGRIGKKIGEVYFDFSEGDYFEDSDT
ncbi:hypothetical protein [Pseudophaeobacter flagellatus]|uniref:hypothetical protein n=1 Tax=Pseudophaeobacter flagellatus TaxID=2899119 RepID=UPI001E3860ED|nr:hypothetical protein [Pseudophaeobacter flagellatus]MCD9147795.1 hypothetical protein [Pseudophaeobacter flagellatus]